MRLNPADADGTLYDQQIESQHSTVQTYCSKQHFRIWRLKAGVAYICYMDFTPQGGTWQYHQINSLLSIMGRAWAY